MRYLPNCLSAGRLVAGIGVGVACAFGFWVLAWWLFAVAALSDAVDGPLARRLHATSDLGSKLDRLGDFTLLSGAALGLVLADMIPVATLVGCYISLTAGVLLQRHRMRNYPSTANASSTDPLWSAGVVALVVLLMALGGGLAIKAYGAHWWFLVVAAAVATTLGVLRRDRLRPE